MGCNVNIFLNIILRILSSNRSYGLKNIQSSLQRKCRTLFLHRFLRNHINSYVK